MFVMDTAWFTGLITSHQRVNCRLDPGLKLCRGKNNTMDIIHISGAIYHYNNNWEC